MRTRCVAAWLLLCAGGLGALGAQAQTRYHCRTEEGYAYTLTRPCPAGSRTSAVSAGPAPAQYSSSSRQYGSSVPLAPEMPEHHQHMSGRCRILDENIRSAYTRRIKQDVLEGMRREYRRDCQEEEMQAQKRVSEERWARDRERLADEKESRLAAQQSEEQEKRQAEQCAESRRILASKRARTDLTEGEKNDLRRFEEAFLARCKR